MASFRIYSLSFLLWFMIGQTGYVFAKTDLTSSLGIREEYDDNIFLEPDQKVHDFITLVTPGLNVASDNKRVRASLDYQLDLRFYQNNSKQDQTSLRESQRLRADAVFFPERDFTINFLDDYSSVVIDERLASSANNPFINKANRNLLEIKPAYRLRQFKKVEPGIAYRYRDVNFTRGGGDDSESQRLDTDILFKASQNLRFTARYGMEQFHSPTSDDYDRQDVFLGLEADPRSTVKLGFEVGRGWIDVEKENSSSSLLVNTRLNLQFSPRTKAAIDYRQNFLDSVENGLVKEQRGETILSYVTKKAKMEFQIFATRNDYQELAREDRSLGLRLTSDLSLDRRTSLGVSGFQTWYRFEQATAGVDDVSRYGVETWLAYQLRILNLRAGYRYEENNSELESNDYVSNFAYVEARFRY